MTGGRNVFQDGFCRTESRICYGPENLMTGTDLAGRAFGLYGMCEGAPSLCMCGDSSGSDCRIRRKLSGRYRELNGCRVWSLIAAGRKLTTRTECGLRTILAPVCCYVRYPGEAPFLSGAIRFVAVVLRIVRMARMRVDYFVLSNCFGAVRFIPANEGIDSAGIPFYSKNNSNRNSERKEGSDARSLPVIRI